MTDTQPLELWSTCYDEERGHDVRVVSLLEVPGDQVYATVRTDDGSTYVVPESRLTLRRMKCPSEWTDPPLHNSALSGMSLHMPMPQVNPKKPQPSEHDLLLAALVENTKAQRALDARLDKLVGLVERLVRTTEVVSRVR